MNSLPDGVLSDDKQKTARLSDGQIAVSLKKLNQLMVEGQIFLNNGLGLPSLANQLGLSIHDTSYLINRVTGGNFYHYINQFRVEEAKKLLIAGRIEKLNMVGIAFASGFNSKTAFNTAFKKYTGYSPTAYIKQQKKN